MAAHAPIYLFLGFYLVLVSSDRRIIGGEKAVLREFPYQVALEENGNHLCGGAVLNAEWIVTAAHCLEDIDKANLKVLAGYVQRSNPGFLFQTVNVIQVTYHDDYDGTFNDIGLVKVSPPLQIGDVVKAIPLPSETYEAGGEAVVTGWGLQSEDDDQPSDYLNKLTVPIISKESCQNIYNDKIGTELICAGYLEGGKDACQGDSGGPLVCLRDQRVLCGVVVTGAGCAVKGYPGLYTPTAKYVKWIADKVIYFDSME